MLWLQPAAWLGLVALAAPILMHLLVHRRSEPFPFPTLQFLKPTRLASLRRHRLDDLLLLLVRAAIVAAVVAALAGPLLLTPMRRVSWNSRVVRAIVLDTTEPGRVARASVAQQESESAFRSTIVETADPGEGMRRAAAWLDDVPPARREIVCVSPLAIGAVTAADVSAVPSAIGLRFVRSGSLPQARTIPNASVLAWADTRVGPYTGNVGADLRVRPIVIRERAVTLTGNQTSVRDAERASPTTLPIDIVAPSDARTIVAAAVRAVLAGRTLVPAAGRTARLLIDGAPEAASIRASAVAIHTPWLGDAVARITRDDDVARVAGEAHPTAADRSLSSGPWQAIASGADGASIVAAAQVGNQLIVISGASASDLLTPVLIRSILNAMAPPMDRRGAEIVPIADAQLRAWERPAGPALTPRGHRSVDNVDDDRRWLWVAALCLLALEGWMRARSESSSEVERSRENLDRVA